MTQASNAQVYSRLADFSRDIFDRSTVTRYLPKNPGSPLFMRDLGGQAGRGAPNLQPDWNKHVNAPKQGDATRGY